MGKTLKEIANELKQNGAKRQLIYAFNGTGKTRLSRVFKELLSSETGEDEEKPLKVLYYNAFTEDLFSWDNDLNNDENRKLTIRPNSFTDWILNDEGKGDDIIKEFQHYTNSSKLTPRFEENYSKISFSIDSGNDERIENIKISRGEESLFIWCVFYNLLEEAVGQLNIADQDMRSNHQFDELEYVFIDDPVSSLDENNLIELAVDIATLITGSKSNLKFIITTHNPLFYNVLYNEVKLNSKDEKCKTYILSKNEDETFELIEKKGGSNTAFSYHLYIKQIIEKAIESGTIQRYHFTLLRNLYEKTANFLGYKQWSDLLPKDKNNSSEENNTNNYYKRIVGFSSHSTLSNEEISQQNPRHTKLFGFLYKNLLDKAEWNEKQKEEQQ